MGKRSYWTALLAVALASVGLIAYARADKKDAKVKEAGGLTAKEARRLIARLPGLGLKTDTIRIKDISAMGSSAVVVADVETAFRFAHGDDGKWRVAEVRTGDRKWEDVELIARAINAEKSARARAELDSLATALEAFRRDRGFYVVAKKESTLVDFLSPRYLANVILLDPWHRPYQYEGTRDHFVLRSDGPDGVAGTADDITVSSREAR